MTVLQPASIRKVMYRWMKTKEKMKVKYFLSVLFHLSFSKWEDQTQNISLVFCGRVIPKSICMALSCMFDSIDTSWYKYTGHVA